VHPLHGPGEALGMLRPAPLLQQRFLLARIGPNRLDLVELKAPEIELTLVRLDRRLGVAQLGDGLVALPADAEASP